MSTGISTLPNSVTPQKWQLIFYIVNTAFGSSPTEEMEMLTSLQLGGATCLWSFVVWFFLPDTPTNARFLNHREKLIAVKRVASNEMGIKNRAFNKDQALLALYDPKAILMLISVFAA